MKVKPKDELEIIAIGVRKLMISSELWKILLKRICLYGHWFSLIPDGGNEK